MTPHPDPVGVVAVEPEPVPPGCRVAHDMDWTAPRFGWRPTGRVDHLGRAEQVRPSFGMHYIRHNSSPYFSLTGDVRDYPGQPSRDWGGGCCHDTITAAFPELADLVPWHLAAQDGEPMHYIANARYAFRCYRGLQGGAFAQAPYREEDRRAWLHAVRAGALPGYSPSGLDDREQCERVLETAGADAVGDWLERRAPKLRAEFLAAMRRHGVALIPGRLQTVTLKARADGQPYLVQNRWLVPTDEPLYPRGLDSGHVEALRPRDVRPGARTEVECEPGVWAALETLSVSEKAPDGSPLWYHACIRRPGCAASSMAWRHSWGMRVRERSES